MIEQNPNKSSPVWLNTRWLLAQFGASIEQARAAYIDHVRAGIGLPSIWVRLQDQIIFGDAKFAAIVIGQVSPIAASHQEIPRYSAALLPFRWLISQPCPSATVPSPKRIEPAATASKTSAKRLDCTTPQSVVSSSQKKRRERLKQRMNNYEKESSLRSIDMRFGANDCIFSGGSYWSKCIKARPDPILWPNTVRLAPLPFGLRYRSPRAHLDISGRTDTKRAVLGQVFHNRT